MRTFIVSLLSLVAIPLWAQSVASGSHVQIELMKDGREGMSFYTDAKFIKHQYEASVELKPNNIFTIFEGELKKTPENKLCAYDVNKNMLEEFQRISPHFTDMAGALKFIRYSGMVDDVAYRLLVRAQEVMNKKVHLPNIFDIAFLPNNKTDLEKLLTVVEGFEENHLKNHCFDEAYASFYAAMLKEAKYLKKTHVKALYKEALKRGTISEDTFLLLEKGRKSKLQEEKLTLQSYYQKLKNLRVQYELKGIDSSTFVTAKSEKNKKISRRQHLYDRYSFMQIILMGNVIKKLKERLESPKIEILVYDQTKVNETITLEPMERFRFAIKLLRKEMSLLSLHMEFKGQAPDYLDLITAAYEIGLVPAKELEVVSNLETIWNPNKTFWDKAGIWIKSFVSVASIAIPAPYNFIPTLALVVIEATVFKKKEPVDDTSRLF